MSLPETLKRLRTLAESDSATDGERTAAKKAIERILANNPGISLDDLNEPEEAHIDIPIKQWQDEYLIISAANFLGLKAYDLYRTRKLKQLRVKGDPRLLSTLKDLIREYRPHVDDLLKYYLVGFLNGTFPTPPRPRDDEHPPRKPTEDQLQAALAGMRARRPPSVSDLRLEARPERPELEPQPNSPRSLGD